MMLCLLLKMGVDFGGREGCIYTYYRWEIDIDLEIGVEEL